MNDDGWGAGWADILSRVAATLTAHSDSLGLDIVAVLAIEVPEVTAPGSGLRPLLHQMVNSNIDNVVTSCANWVSTSQLQPTTASLELARRMAEQGIPAHRMVRVYQVGHRLLLRRLLGEIARVAADPAEALTVTSLTEFIDFNLGYINAMSYAAVREYADSDERWNSALGAAATRRLRDVLTHEVDDAVTASNVLRYAVEGTHVGLVLWSPNGATTLRGLAGAVSGLRGTQDVEQVLAVPQDVSTLLVWVRHTPGALPGILERLEHRMAQMSAPCRAGAGEALKGLTGFRETHAQALAARRVAELPGAGKVMVTRYRDVAATSLMAIRPLEAAAWVHTTLGRLAEPGEEMSRLRETLRLYLDVGENASDAAERLFLHRNTVKTRVARAIELLSLPFEQNRLGVALALDYYRQTTEQ